MAKGILEVPAPFLSEVIKTIRAGLDYRITEHDLAYDDETCIKLTQWCLDMETFLGLTHEGDVPS